MAFGESYTWTERESLKEQSLKGLLELRRTLPNALKFVKRISLMHVFIGLHRRWYVYNF